jgi:hypothetical protein
MQSNIDEAMAAQFQGNFLDASDLMKADQTVTISDVVGPNEEQDSQKKRIDKPILSFAGCKKRLILNKTNSKVIAMAHGKKASEWVGKKITLTVRWLEKAFGQTNVPVVRVVPPEGTALTFGMRQKYGSPKPFSPPQ